jgi:L-amino acid N-acyltransferase
MALHLAHGFHEAGRLREAGWKFGRWLDLVYLQRLPGTGTGEQLFQQPC